MSGSRHLRAAALALLLLAGACRSGAPARDHRDVHGPPSVEGYIARLGSPARVEELRPEATVAALELAPDAVVADLGCGPGVFALPLARAVPRGVVYAVDVEPRQLDALRERVAAQGLANVVPVLASYGDAHLPPGRVDLVLIADTYHHLERRTEYVARLARCLRPAGRLALVEYKPGDLAAGPPARHKVAPETRARELEAAGFRLERRFELHRLHDFEVWALATSEPQL